MTTINSKKEAEEIMAELEDLWEKYDRIWNTLSNDDWNKKFGKDWKFADQPYHLAFFDRMIIQSLQNGEKIKKDVPKHMKDMNQINRWNESEFKKRPKSYTPKQSLQDFSKSHEILRKVFQKQTNWDGKVWIPLFFGWSTAKDVLIASLVHAVGEYIELCLRIGKKIDLLPVSMKRRGKFMMLFMSLAVNKEEAVKRDFVLEWNFSGSGAASWTIVVEKGSGTLIAGRAKKPDLSMTMTLESFEKMLRKMKNPMLMMLTGDIKVKGFSKMPVFMKLFPQS